MGKIPTVYHSYLPFLMFACLMYTATRSSSLENPKHIPTCTEVIYGFNPRGRPKQSSKADIAIRKRRRELKKLQHSESDYLIAKHLLKRGNPRYKRFLRRRIEALEAEIDYLQKSKAESNDPHRMLRHGTLPERIYFQLCKELAIDS